MDSKAAISCSRYPLSGYQRKVIAMAIRDGCVLLPRLPDGERKRAELEALNRQIVICGGESYRLLYGRFGFHGEFGVQAIRLYNPARPPAVRRCAA